jgi:hypothetical protein
MALLERQGMPAAWRGSIAEVLSDVLCEVGVTDAALGAAKGLTHRRSVRIAEALDVIALLDSRITPIDP